MLVLIKHLLKSLPQDIVNLRGVARIGPNLPRERKHVSFEAGRNPFALSPQSVAIMPATGLGDDGLDYVPEVASREGPRIAILVAPEDGWWQERT